MAAPFYVRVERTVTEDVHLSIEDAARWFCALSDEDQAQFFIDVAKEAATWESQFGPGHQWWLVGRHLKNCVCATDDARDLVRELHAGLTYSSEAA